MRVLIQSRKNTDRSAHLVLQFGLGMIGSAITDGLLNHSFQPLADIPFDWASTANRSIALSDLSSLIRQHTQTGDRLTTVWSAGISNFYSSGQQVSQEAAPFDEVLEFLNALDQSFSPNRPAFHYISSAGGLFESQQAIDLDSAPDPLRPYGHLKLAQERRLQELFGPERLSIYRPSSVYGPSALRKAQGLINVLVQNGRSGRETVLDAHVMALRDYVYAGDIGNFVSRKVNFGDDTNEVKFLVTSRSVSIFEVLQRIRRTLNLHPRFRFDQNFGNHSHITFSGRVLPEDWRPSTLDVGIGKFLAAPAPALS